MMFDLKLKSEKEPAMWRSESSRERPPLAPQYSNTIHFWSPGSDATTASNFLLSSHLKFNPQYFVSAVLLTTLDVDVS